MYAAARATLLRGSPTVLRHPRPLFPRVALVRPSSIPHARTVASSVSHKPASQNVSHAVTNAQEEASNTVVDVAKKIAGGSFPADPIAAAQTSFSGITGAIASQVPQPVMVLGLAGALPYLGTSLTTIYLAREAGVAAAGGVTGVDPAVAVAVLNNCLDIQVTYGAVLLSFLGALHWGFEFAGYGGQKGYSRLLLGVAPALVAWPTLALSPMTALVTQWVGFTTLWYFDMKVTGSGWTPQWYSQYRFYLSILVGTCIIGTLAGTSYLGPVAGHSQTTHNLELLRAARAKAHSENQGFTSGEIEALSTGDLGDSYVKIQKKTGKDDEEEGDEEGGDVQKEDEPADKEE